MSRRDRLFYRNGEIMRLLENAVRSRQSKPSGSRVRSCETFDDLVIEDDCGVHHICNCKSARLDLFEATLKRVNAELGGLRIVVNGVGERTVREWLHLGAVLKYAE